MKKSKFTDQQVAFALQQAETGTPVEEVCRKMGVSQATFYRWKKVYGGPRSPRLESSCNFIVDASDGELNHDRAPMLSL